MKSLCLLSLLLAGTVAAQTAVGEKPCVGFVPESTSPTNVYAKEPLQAAVMLSGDLEFYASGHEGCWDVHCTLLAGDQRQEQAHRLCDFSHRN